MQLRRSSERTTFLALFLLPMLVGCGGGGGGSTPTTPAQLQNVTGVVRVPVRQSSAALGTLARATVEAFSTEGQPLASAITDGQGRFTLQLPQGMKGVLKTGIDGFQISARLDLTTGSTQRDITPTSTVADWLYPLLQGGGLSLTQIEALLDQGEGEILLEEFQTAFEARTAFTPSGVALNETGQRLKSLENARQNHCQIGQTWCFVLSAPQTRDGLTTLRLYALRKGTGTLGSGLTQLRLPSGARLDTVEAVPGMQNQVVLRSNTTNEGDLMAAFVLLDKNGLRGDTGVFQVVYSPGESTGQPVILDQQARGTLGEKRNTVSP